MKKITIYKEATPEQLEAINKANEILASQGLELIGTRPKDRK